MIHVRNPSAGQQGEAAAIRSFLIERAIYWKNIQMRFRSGSGQSGSTPVSLLNLQQENRIYVIMFGDNTVVINILTSLLMVDAGGL